MAGMHIKKRKQKGEKGIDFVINALLILIGVVALYPLWFVLIASVSSPIAISAGEVVVLPKGFSLTAYELLFEKKDIWVGYRNSILYTFGGTVLDLLVTVPCAYALSRRTLPHRGFIMTLFIITMYFSGGIIPKYLVVNAVGLIDTGWALIIPGCVSVFNLIIVKNFFESNIPNELWEAAQIDGSSHTGFFAKVALPLSPAILAVVSLYCVQDHWNAYLGAQMYIYSPEKKTLQQVIRSITALIDSTLMNDEATISEIVKATQDQQLLKYAIVFVSSLPLIILYPFIQKFLIKGVLVGAVKG